MKPLNVHNLFETARQDTPPEVDVADGVLARLNGQPAAFVTMVNRSLAWISMASTAAAAGIVPAAVWMWQHNTDSINEILHMVSWAV